MKDPLRMIKPAVFVGSSRKDPQGFPSAVRSEIGQALFPFRGSAVRAARVPEEIHQWDRYPATTHGLDSSALARRRDHSQGNQGRLTMSTRKRLPAHEVGSGNIFADLGLPNAEEHQLKAALVVQLKREIAQRGLTQVAAAKLIEIKQPDLSKLLRGDFRRVSVEKLMRMLTAFDQDVEITLKPHRKRGGAGRITFISAA
jgi:predicted XRE-type DNA-binding protein